MIAETREAIIAVYEVTPTFHEIWPQDPECCQWFEVPLSVERRRDRPWLCAKEQELRDYLCGSYPQSLDRIAILYSTTDD